ncbi:hypothetical protein P872_00420 [Rhodonellum psychrophilum GCM71 = DSM 17998]|uniref:Uncharacterized protein n=2 Tax=Rhodonellum TaxID=336827 RepID=U5BTQ8_9BACT|nr:hypothetical protein P872_00420 [Rhodonellum psychrophilum GCM71 = DSM 17998]SDY39294.1 hypothetical protein SAMN05444412_1018 [Rhodonellum ikkaensis]
MFWVQDLNNSKKPNFFSAVNQVAFLKKMLWDKDPY